MNRQNATCRSRDTESPDGLFRSSPFFPRPHVNKANRSVAALSNLRSAASQGRRQVGQKYQEDVMRKTYLITAILLLSAVWAVAQTSPSSPQTTTPGTSSQQSTYPSTSPSQQPATPDASSTTTQTTTTQSTQTSTDGNSIEGCLSGSAGNWTLTDQSGKTWQLAGDTSKLSDHVGHQVRISGTDNSASAASPSGGAMGGAPSSTNPSGSAASSTNPSTGAAPSGAGPSGAQPTFTVKRVKMISSSCPTSK
jgi:Protein of unknown function (DUF5818)